MEDEPPIQREAHRADHEEREDVLRQRVDAVERVGQDQREGELREDAGDHDLDRASREDHEAPEDQRVHRAGNGIAEDLLLRDSDLEHVLQARQRMVRPILDVSEPEIAHQPLDVQRKESGGEDNDEEEYGASCGHLWTLRAVVARAIARASGRYPERMTTTTEPASEAGLVGDGVSEMTVSPSLPFLRRFRRGRWQAEGSSGTSRRGRHCSRPGFVRRARERSND